MTVSIEEIASTTASLNPATFYNQQGVIDTPLVFSEHLSERCQCQVYLKCEHLQNTGSFKIRGATAAMLSLSSDNKQKGVLTASSGNHGAATAKAAQALSIPVTIYVPTTINAAKEKKIVDCGAQLIKVEGATEKAEQAAAHDAKTQGRTYISPYNDLNVMAGQGTLAVEIDQQLPEVDTIFASVGGGGMIGGLGCTFKSKSDSPTIVGCWPQSAPTMLECMKAGKVVEVKEKETLSDGTAGGLDSGAITLPICQQVIDVTVTVTESEIAQAMKLVYDHHGWIIEGAAGVALASLLKTSTKYQGKNVVVILCGGNIPEQKFHEVISL
ncbi:threonine/serine dehydratase [Vibrio sp. S4M6]|uniref:threonine/serine dehydratase n=1 Tax=Vibrio sinus TaxID=2946865 RepID=UPI002029F29C|nr:threonine/serine dehydratase [Vibrio sinus]MCL9782256.1 threonine/serine dehydratase [Vibrio sinus]